MRLAKIAFALVFVLALTSCGGSSGGTTVVRLTSQRIASLAENPAEYKNIFEKLPRAAQEARISNDAAEARRLGFTLLKPAAKPAAQQFLDLYESSSADVITLVGHNREGTFRFSDGSWILLSTLGGVGRPPIAVISCNSSDYVAGTAVGVPTELVYSVAFRTEQLLLESLGAISASGPPGLTAIRQGLNSASDTAVREKDAAKTVKRVVLATGAGTGVVGSAFTARVYSPLIRAVKDLLKMNKLAIASQKGAAPRIGTLSSCPNTGRI